MVPKDAAASPAPQRQRQRRLTKDVVVIGWINPQHVTLSTANVSSGVLDFYPVNGVTSSAQKPLTLLHMGWIAYLGPIHPIWPWNMNDQEKRYVLNWMFKYASNHAPPSGFADEAALLRFVDTRTNYKLYNRFQVAYWVMTNPDEMLGDTPTAEEAEVAIGVTLEPLYRRRVPGEAGPRNGERRLHISPSYQINDGTPDSTAVRAFNKPHEWWAALEPHRQHDSAPSHRRGDL